LAESGGRDRLVGALASSENIETASQDRFTNAWVTERGHGDIEIDAAYYNYGFRHGLLSRKRFKLTDHRREGDCAESS
jgi:hypothetical protein